MTSLRGSSGDVLLSGLYTTFGEEVVAALWQATTGERRIRVRRERGQIVIELGRRGR